MPALREDTAVVDGTNYFPHRDGMNPVIEAGQVESEWVRETLAAPIVKAWNAVVAHVLTGMQHPEREAALIAGDRLDDRETVLALMNDTGFDGYDAGPLASSWRQQPGSPVYLTNRSHDEIAPALAAAEREWRREPSIAIFSEGFGDGTNPDADTIVRTGRALQT